MERPAGRTSIERWLAALDERHLASLRVQEVTRALRALSSTYVERRAHGSDVPVRSGLDGAGKRAAFSLFYAPLHFLAVTAVLETLDAGRTGPRAIVDLGCGSGVAGAAWALTLGDGASVTGVDRHPWAVEEARWTYRQLGVAGRARVADVTRMRPSRSPTCAVAAYTLNELPDAGRRALERWLTGVVAHGGRMLIVEPISRAVAPWWHETAARVVAAGGRADEWRLPIDPPATVRLLGKAAGLQTDEVRIRTLFAKNPL